MARYEDIEKLLGHWRSEAGQLLRIRRLPLLGLRVSYKPSRGRVRYLKIAQIEPEKISLYLSWLGPLETMLHLKLLPDPKTTQLVLVPELESGPESSWEREDFGFPWLFPFKEFHRVSP